jgi:uncharacterized protein (TIGR01777 family)
MVRRTPNAGEVGWDPEGGWDSTPLEGIDAVVHLAGENIGEGRWSASRKDRIERSRIDGTNSLVAGLMDLRTPPRTLVSASAMGYYGDQGETPLDESAPSGRDWLAGLVRNWEGAAQPVTTAGTRLVITRFGLLLSPAGGALAKMLLPFRLGVGGRLGPGTQWMSWITLADTARVLIAALEDSRYQGAINVSTPTPVTNSTFTEILGRVLHRPTLIPAPAFGLRLLLGQMADATILASQRMVPARLQELGFQWNDPSLEGALRRLLSA